MLKNEPTLACENKTNEQRIEPMENITSLALQGRVCIEHATDILSHYGTLFLSSCTVITAFLQTSNKGADQRSYYHGSISMSLTFRTGKLS